MKNIVVIGNGPVSLDCSEFVDSADLVVRFNHCGSKMANTGRKMDVLCFSVGIDQHHKLIKKDFYDIATQAECHWITHVGENLINASIVTEMNRRFKSNICPVPIRREDGESENYSSGMLAVLYLLRENLYKDYRISIVGFSWKGWFGHPWKFEREYMNAAHDAGKLFIMPDS